ncbi:MAG: MarR family transcriptional regulator [Candidatus Aminicenantes bacterium]|nr:MAG: MarR family transcriptional regulator [Candidatus Aminicenantes bacterium]
MTDEKLIVILGEIGKGILAREHKIRKKLGLSEADYRGILCIGKEEKITCQEFSKRMELSVSRGSRVIDRLCEKIYIERVDCDSDRRCKNIWLTKEGTTVRQKIAEEIQNLEDVLTAVYPDAKLMLLKSDLKRLARKL